MGYRHSRADMIDAAVSAAAAEGLSRLTYKSVAQRLAIADRTVVYYFPTKQHLLVAVLDQVGEQLRGSLQTALAGAPATAGDLLARAWHGLRGGQASAAARLYFDLVGLASAGDELLATVATDVAGQWLSWIEERLDEPTQTRRDVACAVLAQLDGLLLLRQVAGDGTADAAARGMGLRPAVT